MKDPDLRPMSRADLEDEVMLLRAEQRVLRNAMHLKDNEILSLKEQATALGNERRRLRQEIADMTVVCCDKTTEGS